MWNHKRCVSLINHLVKDKVIDNYFDFFVGFNKYYDKSLLNDVLKNGAINARKVASETLDRVIKSMGLN